jgi:hypothetical protein
MLAAALFVPALSLLPLGSLWLWQKGYLLYWLLPALALTVTVFAAEYWFLSKLEADDPGEEDVDAAAIGASDFATEREQNAWQAVEAFAARVDPEDLTSREKLIDVCVRTVETVAHSMNPDVEDPLWRFTLPEALALIERVSRDLGPFVLSNVPLGDRLTIAQMLRIYRWRSMLGKAEKAYDIWRIIRLLNPVAAATSEVRERLTSWLYGSARDEIARRLTRALVRQVGRAAIDLYSGRMRVKKVPARADMPNA